MDPYGFLWLINDIQDTTYFEIDLFGNLLRNDNFAYIYIFLFIVDVGIVSGPIPVAPLVPTITNITNSTAWIHLAPGSLHPVSRYILFFLASFTLHYLLLKLSLIIIYGNCTWTQEADCNFSIQEPKLASSSLRMTHLCQTVSA